MTQGVRVEVARWPALSKLSGNDEIGCVLLCAAEGCCDDDLPARISELASQVMAARPAPGATARWIRQARDEIGRVRQLPEAQILATIEDLRLDLAGGVLPTPRWPAQRWSGALKVLGELIQAFAAPEQTLPALRQALKDYAGAPRAPFSRVNLQAMDEIASAIETRLGESWTYAELAHLIGCSPTSARYYVHQMTGRYQISAVPPGKARHRKMPGRPATRYSLKR